MATNKRQQARNERALESLKEEVGGRANPNNKCADCGDKNPGWASWNLGIFLCRRCATIHRKVGVHITKVKSISLDHWTPEQVDNMKKIGNAASNAKYNPRSVRPQIPVDADEVEGVMERYIRQKYEIRAFTTDGSVGQQRQHTGSTSTNSDEPPPLPPKPGRRFFGFRSATAPISRKGSEQSPPTSPRRGGFGRDPSPPTSNKQSRVFGSNIGSSSSVDFDAKLAQLREMGFRDERRNSAVLKGLNGNMDKTIETLTRLGETSHSPNRTGSPAVPPKDDPPVGISISKTRQVASPLVQSPAVASSTNPFDNIAPVSNPRQPPSEPAPSQMLTQQSRSFTTPNPYNPFMPAQQNMQPALDQSFQALNLQQPQQQQALFPNATGGQQLPHSNPYAQTYTPPPGLGQSSTFPMAAQPTAQQAFAPPRPPFAHNPFLRQTRSQNFTPPADSNPFGLPPPQLQSQPNPLSSSSPVSQQPSTYPLYQQPFQQSQQQQQQQPTSPQAQSPFSAFSASNPFGQQQLQQPPPQQQQVQQQQQPYQPNFQTQFQQQQSPFSSQPPAQQYQPQPQPQMPIRHDKTSIMALFNQQSPLPPPQQPSQPTFADLAGPDMSAPKRSATMPVVGSHNPFASHLGATQSTLAPVAENGTAPQANGNAGYHAAPAANAPQFTSYGPAAGAGGGGAVRNIAAGSRESVDFMGQMMNGRHSPDAFAGLSSRFGQ